VRPKPGIWEYVRINVEELVVEELSVSEYLGFKEQLVGDYKYFSLTLFCSCEFSLDCGNISKFYMTCSTWRRLAVKYLQIYLLLIFCLTPQIPSGSFCGLSVVRVFDIFEWIFPGRIDKSPSNGRSNFTGCQHVSQKFIFGLKTKLRQYKIKYFCQNNIWISFWA